MSDQSSTELERQAEAAREKMADTANSIRKKLTAGQMIDEFADMFTGGDLSGALGTLKSQVRDNPLPVALVGAGIAWLAFGKNITSQNSASSTAHAHSTRRPQPQGAGTATKSEGSMISAITDSAQATAETVSDTVSGMAHGLSATAERLRHNMLTGSSHGTRHMQSSVANIADQEPLLVAALGLTLGAVAGAMLPASGLEKEQIGPHAERLREGAKHMVDKTMDSAGRVASKAYEALKEEADRQGLSPSEGATLGERVGNVVQSAAQSAEQAARHELGVEGRDEEHKS